MASAPCVLRRVHSDGRVAPRMQIIATCDAISRVQTDGASVYRHCSFQDRQLALRQTNCNDSYYNNSDNNGKAEAVPLRHPFVCRVCLCIGCWWKPFGSGSVMIILSGGILELDVRRFQYRQEEWPPLTIGRSGPVRSVLFEWSTSIRLVFN